MRRRDGTAGPWASRLLLTVALVLGIFGMHALASESCGLPMAHVMPADQVGLQSLSSLDGMSIAVPAEVHSAGVTAEAVPPVGATLVIACVAVLSLWLLLVRGTRRAPWRSRHCPSRVPWTGLGPASDPRLRPSLSRLCVPDVIGA